VKNIDDFSEHGKICNLTDPWRFAVEKGIFVLTQYIPIFYNLTSFLLHCLQYINNTVHMHASCPGDPGFYWLDFSLLPIGWDTLASPCHADWPTVLG
jgi:hypothetical protein